MGAVAEGLVEVGLSAPEEGVQLATRTCPLRPPMGSGRRRNGRPPAAHARRTLCQHWWWRRGAGGGNPTEPRPILGSTKWICEPETQKRQKSRSGSMPDLEGQAAPPTPKIHGDNRNDVFYEPRKGFGHRGAARGPLA